MNVERRVKALEDAFFAQQDQELLQQMKETLNAETNREELQSISGITDPNILDQLLQLGIAGETVAAMSLVPLVAVAWCDGTIADKERQAILDAAEQQGVRPNTATGQLLQAWLSHRPQEDLVGIWTDYIQAVCKRLAPGDQIKLSEQVLGRCRAVAEAAGGFLGLGSISSGEHQLLTQLAQAFDQ